MEKRKTTKMYINKKQKNKQVMNLIKEYNQMFQEEIIEICLKKLKHLSVIYDSNSEILKKYLVCCSMVNESNKQKISFKVYLVYFQINKFNIFFIKKRKHFYQKPPPHPHGRPKPPNPP